MAAGMHLGVTPQAVYNSLFYHCVLKIFLSFQIENEKATSSLPNVLFLCFPFGLSVVLQFLITSSCYSPPPPKSFPFIT